MGRPAGGGRASVSAVGAPLTLGTAGHIDHGKTALVKALTGVDCDRLPAERARGMTIELGYAPLTLPGGRRVSVVDVPGHERFVRTMVAGATGIDLYLMAIAADDGVMPQTREHAAVLGALAVGAGVVAITKSDAADPSAAAAAAGRLLPGAEVVACSSRTGEGLADLRTALGRVAARVRPRASVAAPVVLHVDRVFTVHGAGTVLTGTLWSGAIAPGDTLHLLPPDRAVRVRGVQVHGLAVDTAVAGQRVAVNLAGVAVADVSRGAALVGDDATVRASRILDIALALDEAAGSPPRRVQVHHGTRDVAARLIARGKGDAQLRLEQPLLVAGGDRLVIRRIAPPDTIGGGVVLDPAEPVRASEPVRVAPAADEPLGLHPDAVGLAERLRAAGHEPPSRAALRDDARHLEVLRDAGLAVRIGRDMYAHRDAIADVRARVIAIIGAEGAITLARLRDELDTSRRFALALLEHLDAERVTRRCADDSRVLRRSPPPG